MPVCLCYICCKKKPCQFYLCAGNLFCIDSVRVWVHFIEFCIQVSQILKHKRCTSAVHATHSCNENSHALHHLHFTFLTF